MEKTQWCFRLLASIETRTMGKAYRTMRNGNKNRDSDPVVRLLKILFIIFVSLFVYFFAVNTCQGGDIETETYIKEVEDYIKWFHQNAPYERTKRALTYAPIVVEYSLINSIDPLLPSVQISCESSWLFESIGYKKKEKGLMQVHGVAATGYNLKIPSGQIAAGINWLKYSIIKCESLKKGISHYATGKCMNWKGADRRIRLYKEAIKRHRKRSDQNVS